MRAEGEILDVVGTEILRLAPCYSQSPQTAEFTPPPPHGFFGLEISTATADSGWGFCIVYIISLKVQLLFLLLHFIYMCILFFPIKTTIRNASKGGKPDRKPTIPMVSEIHTKLSMNEKAQVCS